MWFSVKVYLYKVFIIIIIIERRFFEKMNKDIGKIDCIC